MKDLLEKLDTQWKQENLIHINPESKTGLIHYENQHDIIIPSDFKKYFLSLNGSNDYDENFFRFYPLKNVEKFYKKFHDWNGFPDYSTLAHSNSMIKNLFVFSDFQFHMFSYAAEFSKLNKNQSQIFAISGNKFEIVAKSFSEFLQLYFDDSPILFLDGL
ncbi:MAG: SMI1/KNR4 family protein [Bacteroidota bacterium]